MKCSHLADATTAGMHAAGASQKSVSEVEIILETIWATAVQPLVMGLAGASVQFSVLPSGVALKSLAVAAIGE